MTSNPISTVVAYFLGTTILVLAIVGFLFFLMFVFAWSYGLFVTYPSPPKLLYVYSAYTKDGYLYIHVKSITNDNVLIQRVVIETSNQTVYKIYDIHIMIKPYGCTSIVVPFNGTAYGYIIYVIPFNGLPATYVIPPRNTV